MNRRVYIFLQCAIFVWIISLAIGNIAQYRFNNYIEQSLLSLNQKVSNLELIAYEAPYENKTNHKATALR